MLILSVTFRMIGPKQSQLLTQTQQNIQTDGQQTHTHTWTHTDTVSVYTDENTHAHTHTHTHGANTPVNMHRYHTLLHYTTHVVAFEIRSHPGDRHGHTH